MIKFDLHIHSFASKYKENASIVDASTIENAEVLLQKLNEAQVGLFSITDHNRFWPELYTHLDELMSKGSYPNVQGLVAGVEFDVKLDPDMAICHIITIFDSKNQLNMYQKIHNVIENHKLTNQNEAYSKDDFETILREIGLDVILIACQHTSLERHESNTRSLSESTMEPEKLILSGYINALEFQRPNVEGILRNNLQRIPAHTMLVSGSDCHEWIAYPNHDSHQTNPHFKHSRANILPTFKGLLMAVTSPETRINQQENRNREYIQSISIHGQEIALANGLIAIIGENGSGKSSIVKILHGKNSESHVKRIKETNKIKYTNTDSSKRLFIEQGQIVHNFDQKKLFPTDNYIPINHEPFKQAYLSFANNLLEYIKQHIKAKESIEQLSDETLVYNELIHSESYYINILFDRSFSEVDNPHFKYNKEIEELMKKVLLMRSDTYYKDYQREWNQVIEALNHIYRIIHAQYDTKVIEQQTKNHIVSASTEYSRKVEVASSSLQRDQKDYLDSRQTFIQCIFDAVNSNSSLSNFPAIPIPMQGCSTNPKHGFNFNSEASYHDRNVLSDFLNKMFVNEYKSIEALKQIDNYEDLKNAIFRCNSIDQIDEQYQKNLRSFLDEMCICKQYIVDTSQGESELGNTLGEMSLAFFKYITERENEKTIFLIDQPEDHISNNNISLKLLRYFNSIRTKKQIIMVTHNPLLVVNQDVDQVLYISQNGEKINVVSGCLEYENDSISMLDIIAKNMDGGRDSIERRLKVYGKENSYNHEV